MSKKALLVIDVQNGIVQYPGMHDVPSFLDRIHHLQEQARNAGVPLLIVQHDGPEGHPVQTGTEGWQIHDRVAPAEHEPVIRKKASDAFFQTTLQGHLNALGITDLIITGCMTQYCVDTTCRRAVTLGYNVTLVSDAHSTANEGELSAAQIIRHHNTILEGFAAADRQITVLPSSEIKFDA